MRRQVRVLVVGRSHDALRTALEASDRLTIVGQSDDLEAAAALVLSAEPDVVAVDGSCEAAIRFARSVAQSREVPVLLLAATVALLDDASAAPPAGMRAIACDGSSGIDGAAAAVVRTQLSLLGARHAGKRRPSVELSSPSPSAGPFDLVVLLGSAGTPLLLPELLAPARIERVPLAIVVHHNPRFGRSFRDWVGRLMGAPSHVLVPRAGIRSPEPRLWVASAPALRVVPTDDEVGDPPLLPDLDEVLEQLVARRLKLLACVASGMGNQGLEGLRRVRLSGGHVVALRTADCSHPTMVDAARDADLVSWTGTVREVGGIIASALQGASAIDLPRHRVGS